MCIRDSPTGISMSFEKKIKLLELAEKYDFYILEDDGLSNLYFDRKKPETLSLIHIWSNFGSEIYCRVRGYIATMKKNGQNQYEALKSRCV